METKKDLRTTWPEAIGIFLFPIFLVLCVRWLIFEPYVIPSGSMLPTLLINDHIFVNKLSYGLQNPFSGELMWLWKSPQRGDIFVFRFPENPQVFFVKRLVGLPGDKVEIRENSLYINDQMVAVAEANSTDPLWSHLSDEDHFRYMKESMGSSHLVRWKKDFLNNYGPEVVPEGHYFAMGDNRSQSHDSRFWGFVPQKNLIGRGSLIWLSCNEMLPEASFICNPLTLRWNRLLKFLQ